MSLAEIHIDLCEEFAKSAAQNGREDPDYDLLMELIDEHDGTVISIAEEVLKRAREGEYDEQFTKEQIGRMIDQAIPQHIILLPLENSQSMVNTLSKTEYIGVVENLEFKMN